MWRARLAASLALLALPLGAAANPPDACSVVKIEDINQIAGGGITKVRAQRSGNPSECAFLDSRRAAVLVISIGEVKYAAENELQHERENLEKIYRTKAKWLTTVGENAFWLDRTNLLMFRKAKMLVSVTFNRKQNQNEADTAQVARLVEAQIK